MPATHCTAAFATTTTFPFHTLRCALPLFSHHHAHTHCLHCHCQNRTAPCHFTAVLPAAPYCACSTAPAAYTCHPATATPHAPALPAPAYSAHSTYTATMLFSFFASPTFLLAAHPTASTPPPAPLPCNIHCCRRPFEASCYLVTTTHSLSILYRLRREHMARMAYLYAPSLSALSHTLRCGRCSAATALYHYGCHAPSTVTTCFAHMDL